MNDDQDDPLRSLDREVLPPANLKSRVIATLSQRGLIRRASNLRRWGGLVAAAIVLFAAGLLLGRRTPVAEPAANGPQFVLLLYEDSTFHLGMSHQDAIAEYRAWAHSLRAHGTSVDGTALDSPSWVLHASGPDVETLPSGVTSNAGVMSGFFVIGASSEAEALAIAKTCPHLRHGGRIAVRPVIPT